MKEEENQSVRYSEIMSNLSDDSFETSSTKMLLTRKNEIKKAGQTYRKKERNRTGRKEDRKKGRMDGRKE